jgi:NADH-quinone oxidoreductase subunit E
MAVRRLNKDQPESFAFTPENLEWAKKVIARYPEGREWSAVIPLFWRAQRQEGWLTEPAIRTVCEMIDMPYIRGLEVATFYTMFNLSPVGDHLVQVCTTTPCWLRGSDEVVKACKKHIHEQPHTVSDDGKLSWMEVECLGACVNAPMAQINDDYYEDLTGERMAEIIAELRAGKTPKTGPQAGRHASEPEGGATTLTEVGE